MSVLITFVAINYEEMLKKDFASKYFLGVNVVVITNPLSMINHILPSLFLSSLSFTRESAETEEHLREIHN